MTKRVGRAKVSASQRRGEIIRFVVTKADAKQFRAKANGAGLTISEYLRRVAIPKE